LAGFSYRIIHRKKLKEGVYRDIERQALRKEMGKTINQYNLQQQKELEKILRKEEAAATAAAKMSSSSSIGAIASQAT
jgi:hypothetical protein